MKAIILVLLVFNSFLTYGQNITLREFVDLNNGRLADIEEFLSTRKWEIYRTQKDGINFINGNGIKTSVISYLFNTDGSVFAGSITFYSQEGYLQYLEGIKKLECILIETKIKENGILKIYRNDKYHFEINIIEQDEISKLPMYTINLFR